MTKRSPDLYQYVGNGFDLNCFKKGVCANKVGCLPEILISLLHDIAEDLLGGGGLVAVAFKVLHRVVLDDLSHEFPRLIWYGI